MLRSYLLTYPFILLYVTAVVPVFVPLTWLLGSIRPIYWMARLGCRGALALAGVRVKVVNAEHARMHPCCVFVANHVSNIEAPALFAVLPRVAVIIKDSLGRIPLLGYTMRMGGFIPVDRAAKHCRRKALQDATRTLQSGISMLVFPEGTRSPAGRLLPFRPGPFRMAIKTGVPVVPITVHNARALMPKGVMHLQPGVLTLAFHKPVATDNLAETDRMALLSQVRQSMQSALDSLPA